MFCKKCGKYVQPNENFCPYCGAEVEKADFASNTDETKVIPNIQDELNSQGKSLDDISEDIPKEVEYVEDDQFDFPEDLGDDEFEFAEDDEDDGEIRSQRHRMTRTGKSSIFSGMVYCADCGSKMQYGSSNNRDFSQDFFDCSLHRKNGAGARDTSSG